MHALLEAKAEVRETDCCTNLEGKFNETAPTLARIAE